MLRIDATKPLILAGLFACVTIAACSSADKDTTNRDQSPLESAAGPSATDTMVADPAASAEARAALDNEEPLYQRIGGHEGITEFVAKLIDLHMKNELVKPFFEGVDMEALTTHLVDFIGAGTGGAETYRGRSVLDSHAGMGITPEVFRAALDDIAAAAQAVGWGAGEQGEFKRLILSMRGEVCSVDTLEALKSLGYVGGD